MSPTKTARTREEMRFAAELQPCPECGWRGLGALELHGGGNRWTYEGACPQCRAPRRFEFVTEGDPAIASVGRFDLGAGVTTLISPEEFLAVLDDAAPRVPADPSALTQRERRDAMVQLTRALTSVSELLKLAPFGESLPGSDVRLSRPWLEAEFSRLRRQVQRYRPPRSIEQIALDAHLAWLARGGSGPGHLTVAGMALNEELYGPVDFTFAAFTDVDLTHADLGYAVLDEADLVRCTLHGTVLDGASVTNARIEGGDWSGVQLSTARLNAAEIDGTDFSRADLERSYWYDATARRARFDGARFANSVLDRAVFEDCSFRAATFVRMTPDPAPTSEGARFFDCDFSDVDFTQRDLRNTIFVRCRLAAAKAPPAGDCSGLVLDDCDVSLARFLASAA